MTNSLTKLFLNISIRGRVAFGICSLLEAINKFDYSRMEWQVVIDQLIKFTDMDLIEDWFYETVEYTPEAILQNIPFSKKKWYM